MPLIEDKIYSILSTATSITDEVSTRIYPYTREQGSVLPAITYDKVSTNTHETKEAGSTIDDYRIQFNVFAHTAREAARISDLLRVVLDRFTDTDIVESTYNANTGDYQFDAKTYLDITDYSISLKRTP